MSFVQHPKTVPQNTHLQSVQHLTLAPRNHPKPVAQDPDARKQLERDMNHPRDRAQWTKKRQCTLQKNDDMVPLLAGEHVECTAEDKISHAVKAEPEQHVSHVSDSVCQDIRVNAFFQLLNQWNDAFLIMVQCCVMLAFISRRKGFRGSTLRGESPIPLSTSSSMHLLDARGHKRLLGIEQVVPVRFDTASLRAIHSQKHIRVVDCNLAGTWKGGETNAEETSDEAHLCGRSPRIRAVALSGASSSGGVEPSTHARSW